MRGVERYSHASKDGTVTSALLVGALRQLLVAPSTASLVAPLVLRPMVLKSLVLLAGKRALTLSGATEASEATAEAGETLAPLAFETLGLCAAVVSSQLLLPRRIHARQAAAETLVTAGLLECLPAMLAACCGSGDNWHMAVTRANVTLSAIAAHRLRVSKAGSGSDEGETVSWEWDAFQAVVIAPARRISELPSASLVLEDGRAAEALRRCLESLCLLLVGQSSRQKARLALDHGSLDTVTTVLGFLVEQLERTDKLKNDSTDSKAITSSPLLGLVQVATVAVFLHALRPLRPRMIDARAQLGFEEHEVREPGVFTDDELSTVLPPLSMRSFDDGRVVAKQRLLFKKVRPSCSRPGRGLPNVEASNSSLFLFLLVGLGHNRRLSTKLC